MTAELTTFIEQLDKRSTETQADIHKHFPRRKNRMQSSPLESFPPPNFPKWTVSKEWLKGVRIITHNTVMITTESFLIGHPDYVPITEDC